MEGLACDNLAHVLGRFQVGGCPESRMTLLFPGSRLSDHRPTCINQGQALGPPKVLGALSSTAVGLLLYLL